MLKLLAVSIGLICLIVGCMVLAEICSVCGAIMMSVCGFALGWEVCDLLIKGGDE